MYKLISQGGKETPTTIGDIVFLAISKTTRELHKLASLYLGQSKQGKLDVSVQIWTCHSVRKPAGYTDTYIVFAKDVNHMVR